MYMYSDLASFAVRLKPNPSQSTELHFVCVCVQVKGLTKVQRNEKLKKIQEMFQKAREYSDDKVQIAMQMYEMVGQLCVLIGP